MSLDFGPKKIGIGITDSSQVSVVHALDGSDASLASPITVSDAGVSFTVSSAGRYRVTAVSDYYSETMTVDLAPDLPYDTTDLRSMVEYLINHGGTGGGGGVSSYSQITSLADYPSTFPPEPHTHTVSDISGLQGELDSKANSSDLFSGSYTDLTDQPTAADIPIVYNSTTGTTESAVQSISDIVTLTTDGLTGGTTNQILVKTSDNLWDYSWGTLAPADIGAATSAQGALADTSVQPNDLNGYVESTTIDQIVSMTQAEYDSITPSPSVLYVIVG